MATESERALCALEFDEKVGRMRLSTRIRSAIVMAEIGNVRMELHGYDTMKDLYDVLGRLMMDIRTVEMANVAEKWVNSDD